jgi:hypothetical protein
MYTITASKGSTHTFTGTDGNAYTHLYWLATKDTDEDLSGRGAITPRLHALSDLKAKLKIEMCKSHRLGSAKTGTGYLQLLDGL